MNLFLVLYEFLYIFNARHAPMTSNKYIEMYGELKYESTRSIDLLILIVVDVALDISLCRVYKGSGCDHSLI